MTSSLRRPTGNETAGQPASAAEAVLTSEQPPTFPIVLPTATSRYVVSPGPDDPETGICGLVLDDWCAADAEPTIWRHHPKRYEELPDLAPFELGALGTRQIRGSELVVDHGNGMLGIRTQLDPDRVSVSEVDGVTTLSVPLTETGGAVEVSQVISTSTGHDVVSKHAVIRNVSDHPVLLRRAFGGAWQIPVGPGVRIDHLSGMPMDENRQHTVRLPAGELSLGHRAGTSSHYYPPVLTVAALDASDTDRCYSFALAYSGSRRMLVDAHPDADRIRVTGGVDDESNTITLDPGESFTTPALLGLLSPEGSAGVPRRWQQYARSELARSNGTDHHPIVYNSWFATIFDVDVRGQSELAEIAADLGVECFVLDDGWFRGRNDDFTGLGDWEPDPVKFPEGLEPLVDKVTSLGMRFGIWVEPEAVNPDSDLYREHPEWIYRAGDRPLLTHRHQYVLDFGRAEVVEWTKQWLRNLLSSADITFLKWDMNRAVSDGGRPGDGHGAQWSVQHAAGYLEVMQMLRDEFPQVTVEACASGAGRVDHQVLGVSDVVWTSDQTGPRDRLRIQHGFLGFFPASINSTWITDWPDEVDTEPASFEFRSLMAMCGNFGIGYDLRTAEKEKLDATRQMVQRFNSIRDLVLTGEVVRHGEPGDDHYAVEFGSPQLGRSVVLAFGRGSQLAGVRGPSPLRTPFGSAGATRFRRPSAWMLRTATTPDQREVRVGWELADDADCVLIEH